MRESPFARVDIGVRSDDRRARADRSRYPALHPPLRGIQRDRCGWGSMWLPAGSCGTRSCMPVETMPIRIVAVKKQGIKPVGPFRHERPRSGYAPRVWRSAAAHPRRHPRPDQGPRFTLPRGPRTPTSATRGRPRWCWSRAGRTPSSCSTCRPWCSHTPRVELEGGFGPATFCPPHRSRRSRALVRRVRICLQ